FSRLIRIATPAPATRCPYTTLFRSIPDTHLDFFGAYGFWEFAAIFIAFALGEALIPPYAQRALAAQNPLSARKGYARAGAFGLRSEEHTSELQSRFDLVCRLLLEQK